MNERLYWIYILYCKNNTYYTGYTINLESRYQAHLNGIGKCKYTRSFRPLRIEQSWQIKANKAIAMKVERFIKKLSRIEKENLISSPDSLTQVFPNLFITQKYRMLSDN